MFIAEKTLEKSEVLAAPKSVWTLFLHNILFYLPLFQKILIILSLVYVLKRDIPLLQNSKIWSILQMKNAYWQNWVQVLSKHSRSSIIDIAVNCIISSCVFLRATGIWLKKWCSPPLSVYGRFVEQWTRNHHSYLSSAPLPRICWWICIKGRCGVCL